MSGTDDDKVCSMDDYSECKSTTITNAQNKIDANNSRTNGWHNGMNWVAVAVAVATLVAGGGTVAVASKAFGRTMLTGIIGNSFVSGGSQAYATNANAIIQCGQEQDACQNYSYIVDATANLQDFIEKEKGDAQKAIGKAQKAMVDYVTSSRPFIRTYADRQQKIAQYGWRFVIFIFFIVLADILGIWPISKIFSSN